MCQRLMSTAGDADLSNFLSEEIEYEHECAATLPELNNFTAAQEGTRVVLTRKFKDERVAILFDINENHNIDESAEPAEGEEDASNIMSYPHFTVSIEKVGTGKKLELECVYDVDGPDEAEPEGEDKGFDMFRIEQVRVLAKGQTSKDAGVYEAETESMDGNLYACLMHLLVERGVDAEFADQLVEYSTTAEQIMHTQFLENLKKFVDA